MGKIKPRDIIDYHLPLSDLEFFLNATFNCRFPVDVVVPMSIGLIWETRGKKFC